MNIRQLAANDAPVYQPLRLRALREHPEAFGSSLEDEQLLPLEQVARRLDDTSGNSVSFGAWSDCQLVGIVSLFRSPRLKTRHKALLGGMYVAPEARGNSVGKALLEHTLSYARTMGGLEDVTLAVTVGTMQPDGCIWTRGLCRMEWNHGISNSGTDISILNG